MVEQETERVCNCGLKESEHNVRHPFIPRLEPELEKAAEEEASSFYEKERLQNFSKYKQVFIKGAKLQAEQNSWKLVSEETPPTSVELLVKSPNGIIYLSSWRESYQIFSCQEKSEASLNWKWRTI